MRGCDFTFHLAANADVRFGVEHPGKDFEQNTRATFHVLEAVRTNGIRGMAFSSTGSVYGEAQTIPTPEDCPFPIQTSLYGASKLAGEGMIQAYCEGFGIHAYIFRFVSILGPRYTHGHIIDFYKQLMDHPSLLKVLGDGTQRKSYLHVHDCVRAILHVIGLELATQSQTSGGDFQFGYGWVLHGPRFHRVDLCQTRPHAHFAIQRWRSRMDRRQPFHLSRHAQGARSRMGSRNDYPAECRGHSRLAQGK